MSRAPRPARLRARELGVELPGGRVLFEGLDLDLEAGFVAIVGPNGSGKSTLLRTLAGLRQPSTGTVELEGRPIREFRARARARRISYLPQSSSGGGELRVRELVALGRAPHLGWFSGLTPRDEGAIDEALRECGVEAFAQRRVAKLSGGERQRVRLARMLATDAPIALLDEPTTALDVGHALALCGLLRRLADRGTLVVAALHQLELARRHADEVWLLDGRGVARGGAGEEILTPAQLDGVFDVRTSIVEGHLVFEARDEGPLAETVTPPSR